jgi:chorismate mutase
VSEQDPIDELRRRISANDGAILHALNTRLELVAQIKHAKAERGIGFVDAAREEEILRELERANGGPLTAEGLQEIFREILDLTKREVAKREDQA